MRCRKTRNLGEKKTLQKQPLRPRKPTQTMSLEGGGKKLTSWWLKINHFPEASAQAHCQARDWVNFGLICQLSQHNYLPPLQIRHSRYRRFHKTFDRGN